MICRRCKRDKNLFEFAFRRGKHAAECIKCETKQTYARRARLERERRALETRPAAHPWEALGADQRPDWTKL